MNNFKKFVAVLLGVVMACVFATSAFAADFSNADTAAKAKAEIKAFAASYGITTIDNTVNSLTADQLQVIYNNMDALKATAASANATIGLLATAIDSVSTVRSALGATANRLDHVNTNLSNIATNTKAATGRIMDTDFATESSNMTSSQMLLQAGTAMLKQSNSMSSMVMSLLQ